MTWDDALDAFASRLATHRASIAGGEEPEPFVPPEGLGPLPPALRARASELLRASAALERELAAAIATTARELVTVRRLTADGDVPVAPRFVDRAL